MNQAEVTKLMSQLRINVGLRPRKSKSVSGYRGSLESLRKQVTALVTHERLELVDTRAATVRQYTEKLISDAVLYGDKHKHTMEMAQWWLENDKSAVHKLFKVLVPRYQDYTTCYTRLLNGPRRMYTLDDLHKDKTLRDKLPSLPAIVELKGHPFPPLMYSNTKPNKKHIHNVLLAEAKRDMERLKLD